MMAATIDLRHRAIADPDTQWSLAPSTPSPSSVESGATFTTIEDLA
jgi:hypothetical protein